MDEVAVYNTALSAGQIAAQYQATSEPSYYYYTVKAVNASGSSAASNEAAALNYPTVSTGLAATPVSASQIDLSWTASSGAISGYNIYRGTTPGGENYSTPINGGTLVTTTTYSDTTANYTSSVLNDNPAGYYLMNETAGTTAVNIGNAGAAGNGAYSAVTLNQPGPSLTGMADTSAFLGGPSAPSSMTVGGLTLGNSYTVEMWIDDTVPWSSQGMAYLAGRGGPAGYDTIGVVGSALGAYTGQLIIFNGASYSIGPDVVTMNAWHDVAYTRSGNNVAVYLDGTLEISITLSANYGSSSAIVVGVRPDNNWYFTGNMDEVAVYNTALSAGQIAAQYQATSEPSYYYYTVKAVNASGSSAASNEAAALNYPTVSTGLAATPVSASQIDLSWTASSGAISGYNIYRGTTPGGENYSTPINGGTLVTTTTYSDTTASSGTTYYYTVKAVNASGSSVASKESDPLTYPAAPTSLARQRLPPRRST